MQGLKERLISASGDKTSLPQHRPSALLSRLTRERDAVMSKKSKLSHSDGVWLCENYYLIERGARLVNTDGITASDRLLCITNAFARFSDTLDSESVSALYEVLSRDSDIDDRQLEAVKNALITSCLYELCRRCEEKEELGTRIELLRRVEVFDFLPFYQGFSEAERYLRADPDGTWQRMDKESRGLYKAMLKKMAEKRGVDYTSMCKTVSLKACENSSHIGEYIDFGGKSGLSYYCLQAFCFVLLLSLCGYCLFSQGVNAVITVVFLSLVLPVFETSTRLSAFLLSLFHKSSILPRVDIDAITSDVSTLVCVTSLVTDKKELDGLFAHLEALYLKSRSRKRKDEGLYFGLLCDLPESKSPMTDKEMEVVNVAQKWVESLNSRYGEHFVFFIRDGVLDKESGMYVAHERKRGALLELSRLVLGKRSSVKSVGARLPKIKYIVTLDSDTDMTIGALSELVGTMEHPLNRPHVAEKDGVRYVDKGYGIVQPFIQPSLIASFKTPFSLLMSGAGGFDTYHGPVFDLFHVIHRRTMFCGKGIFDVAVFNEVLENAFPDGIVLSHDMLEGSRLRAGLIPIPLFYDSIPKNAISFFKRAHRWARGDVQSLVFTTKRVCDKGFNRVKNPQPLSDRWVFWQNYFNLLSPVFSFLALFLACTLKGKIALTVFLFATSPLWLYSVLQFMGMIWRLSFSTLFRRFFTEAVTGMSRELLYFLYSLSALFYRAYVNLTAIATSLWRLAVSGKGLLEWSTASQVESSFVKKGGIFYYLFATLPSLVAGIALVILSVNPYTRLAGFMWCAFFAVAYLTATEKEHKHTLRLTDRDKLIGYTEKSWKFFASTVDEASSHLPCDNVSISPNYAVASRTSPTNIGMYLLSALAACDLGFIGVGELFNRLENTLSTLESLPRHRGHFYNWYDTVERCVIGQEYISTVDSGNLAVSIVALVQGIYEYRDKDKRAVSIAERFANLEREMDFRFLYDNRRRLFSIGYNVEREELDSSYYDLYMSEMRTTDYYAVARGIVEKEHWSALSRSLVAHRLTIGAASWSGTAFEYFMPHLFLPVCKNSFNDEALGFAFAEQVEFSHSTRSGRIWGTSECGYFAFDRDMNYQYRAFGVPTLSLCRDREKEKVFSPYSSFLMMFENPSVCLKNLERMKDIGMWGEWGFYEAVDFSPSRTGGGFAPIKSYMSHHVGMSITAAANLLLDGIFVKRFMRDSEMGSAVELLQERIPVDAVILKNSTLPENVSKPPVFIPLDTQSVCRNRERCSAALLSGRDISVIADECGVAEINLLGISALRGTPISFLPYTKSEKGIFSPLYQGRFQFVWGRGCVKYKNDFSEICINASGGSPTIRVRASVTDNTPCEKGIYIEPSAVTRSAYVSHPAYADLFFEGYYRDGCVVLEYHGKEKLYVCLASNGDYEFELFRETVFSGKEASLDALLEYTENSRFSCKTGTLLSPCIFARQKNTRTDALFVVSFAKTMSEALRCAKEELALSGHTSISLSDRYERRLYSAVGISNPDRQISERLLSVFVHKPVFRFCDSLPEHQGRCSLWSFGVSGDYPIVLVSGGLLEEKLESIIRLHKLHYISGVRYDLVFLCRDLGYKRIEGDRINKLVDSCRARFIVGVSGGIFIVGAENEMLFRNASTVIIDNDKALSSTVPSRYMNLSPEKPVFSKSGLPSGFSTYGYTVDKGEYNPSILWNHIIASDTFGTVVTTRGLGHTWVFNAGLSRIGVWENDRVGGGMSEKLYLIRRDGILDLCYSASRVDFEAGRAVYHSSGYTLTVACHPKLMYKEITVHFEGRAKLLYKLNAVMGDGVSRVGNVYCREIENGMIFSSPLSDTLENGFGYLVAVGGDTSATPVGLEAEGEGEIRFILGYAGSDKHFETALRRIREGSTVNESVRFAQRFLPERKDTSFNADTEHMYNYALPLQCAISRILARSGPYQAGGAWGCRDQAQDMLFMIDTSPERVKAHLFRIASHQYEEGDIQHWWHGFRGTRTLCSDDYLWFVLLLSVYVEKTGDHDILQRSVGYRTSNPLGENEWERYEYSSPSSLSEPLILHAKRCLDLFVKRGVGKNGIPLMLGGDWNDGMDRIGRDGGESVWLGFFAISVFYKVFALLESCGIETSEYRDFCKSVYDAIEKNAFFRDRYARAFLGDGTPIGVEGCDACEIDGMVSAFASICHKVSGLGNPSRISATLDCAWKHLYDEKNKLYKLFTRSFTDYDERIGYVSSYPEGVRENGGQYTHGAVFSGLGFLWASVDRKKNFERAEKVLSAVLPCGRDADIFKTEPYVLSADIYSNPTHSGRGGWSFYTGSAGWCRYLMSEIEKERNKK